MVGVRWVVRYVIVEMKMSDVEYKFQVVVRMITEEVDNPSLSSCEVEEYDVQEVPDMFDYQDIFSWTNSGGVINALFEEGFRNGLFAVDGVVNIDYHQDHWGDYDEYIEYPKFEVTELEGTYEQV